MRPNGEVEGPPRSATQAPRARILSFSARGAKQSTPHGPLQGWLGGALRAWLERNGHIVWQAQVRTIREWLFCKVDTSYPFGRTCRHRMPANSVRSRKSQHPANRRVTSDSFSRVHEST